MADTRSVVGTVVKLVVASLLLGLVMSFFHLSPEGLLDALGNTGKKIAELLANFIQGSMQYILLGAAVVVPIWLILRLWAIFRNKA